MSEYFSGVLIEGNNLSPADCINLLLNKQSALLGEEYLSVAFLGAGSGNTVFTYRANSQCLVLMDIDYAIDGFAPKNRAAFSFSVADNSAAYQWMLWDGQKYVSTFQSVEGIVLEETGDDLALFGDDTADKIKGYISRLLKTPWGELASQQAGLHQLL